MTFRKSCQQLQLIPLFLLHESHLQLHTSCMLQGPSQKLLLNAWVSVSLPDKGGSISPLIALSFSFSQRILQEMIIFCKVTF